MKEKIFKYDVDLYEHWEQYGQQSKSNSKGAGLKMKPYIQLFLLLFITIPQYVKTEEISKQKRWERKNENKLHNQTRG